jgi:hypothetical protein
MPANSGISADCKRQSFCTEAQRALQHKQMVLLRIELIEIKAARPTGLMN